MILAISFMPSIHLTMGLIEPLMDLTRLLFKSLEGFFQMANVLFESILVIIVIIGVVIPERGISTIGLRHEIRMKMDTGRKNQANK
jgi:hypothetical protein